MSAKATRKHAGSPMGACAERAVAKVSFPKGTEAQSFEHSFEP
jgi:hypothetical protein